MHPVKRAGLQITSVHLHDRLLLWIYLIMSDIKIIGFYLKKALLEKKTSNFRF